MAYVPTRSPSKTLSRGESSKLGNLDQPAEYLDADGIPRWSEKFTRRMVMRGCTLEKATILSANEQAHTALKMSKAEQEEHEREYREALKLSEAKKQANADYKLQLKNSKHQQLVEEAQLIIQRLELWYSNERLSNEDNNVDVTESNTILSPSRTLAFIDQHGNLRRKSVEKPNQDFDSLSDVATSPTSSAASTPSPNMMMATPPPPPPRQTKQ